MNIDQLLQSTNAFAARLTDVLGELQMLEQCQSLEMDHICVRLDDPELVERMRKALEYIGRTISTANVGGRLIHIILLDEPLRVGHWQTKAIELPYPRAKQLLENGWEHVEFVIPNAGVTLKEMSNEFDDMFSHLHYQRFVDLYQRSDKIPSVDGDQKPNPTVGIKSSGVGIKFHPDSIINVVSHQLA